jgi:hypothetical protein
MTNTTEIQETKVLWDTTADKLYVWDGASKAWELFFAAAGLVTDDDFTAALALKLNVAGGAIGGSLAIGNALTVSGAGTFGGIVSAPQISLSSLALTASSGSLYAGGTKVWTENNDGSGSGLDADLLDGRDSGYFTDIPARLGYAPFNAAGGTVGGNVAIGGTLSVTGDVTLAGSAGARFEALTNYDNYIAANAWTKIAFNSANHNDQGAFSAALNRFTAPNAGCYLIGVKWRFKANATVPASIHTRFYKNGSALAYTAAESWGTVVTLKTHLVTQTVLKLAAGDYVEAWAYMETSDGYIDAAESVFYGARIA